MTDSDISTIQFVTVIGNDCTRFNIHALTDQRVADKVEVRQLAFAQHEATFYFAAWANDAIVAKVNASPQNSSRLHA